MTDFSIDLVIAATTNMSLGKLFVVNFMLNPYPVV